jgi:hypothetical protein
MEIGTELTYEQKNTAEILDLFKPAEGTIAFYYGKVRNGKTYAATADILNLLKSGEVVFANWHIDFDGYDERSSFRVALVKFVFGRRDFFEYKKSNFHYFSPTTAPHDLVKQLNKLVGVHIFIDEGHWLLNSHTRNPDVEAQKLILTNGHYCRSLNIVSQRPGNVLKDYRSQVHFWYKCQKKLTWPMLIFQKTIIEDMKDDYPDEDSEENKIQVYLANKEVYMAYNTHAFRGDDAIEKSADFEVYRTKGWQRLVLLISFLVPRLIKRAAGALMRRRRDSANERAINRALEETYDYDGTLKSRLVPRRITDVKLPRRP